MSTAGFNRLTRQAPNHLALVTGDGRHWTREELLAECLRPQAATAVSCGGESAGTLSPPDSPGRQVAMNLAGSFAPGDGGTVSDSADILGQAAKLMARLDLAPEGDNVLYLGAGLDAPGSLQLALCALHWGHPLIIAGTWQLEQFLQAVAQYRVSYCFLSRDQYQQYLEHADTTPDSPARASLQEVLHPETPGLF